MAVIYTMQIISLSCEFLPVTRWASKHLYLYNKWIKKNSRICKWLSSISGSFMHTCCSWKHIIDTYIYLRNFFDANLWVKGCTHIYTYIKRIYMNIHITYNWKHYMAINLLPFGNITSLYYTVKFDLCTHTHKHSRI